MKYVKLGLQIGTVWWAAKLAKDILTAVDCTVFKRVAKKLEDVVNQQEERKNAEKKEESAEEE